jgi:hypothetical protein
VRALKESDALFWQDELLQVLYWLTGEGLGPKVRWQDICALLDADAEMLWAQAEQLTARGFVERGEEADGSRWLRLTEAGRREGGRRFAEAFHELLGQGHGACGPDCDCHHSLSREYCQGREGSRPTS